MQNISKLNSPKGYVIFLQCVVFTLFKMYKIAFGADDVIVEHSFSETEILLFKLQRFDLVYKKEIKLIKRSDK